MPIWASDYGGEGQVWRKGDNCLRFGFFFSSCVHIGGRGWCHSLLSDSISTTGWSLDTLETPVWAECTAVPEYA